MIQNAAPSQSVLDTPTHAAVSEQLADKSAAHQVLLQTLEDCGASSQLHPTVLRCLFEDGQRLAVLANVHQLQSELQRGAGGDAPLRDVVAAAGAACMAAVAGAGPRDPATVFYSVPTSTVTQFFMQLAGAADNNGRQPGQAAVDHRTSVQLNRAVTAALGGVLQQRAQQQQYFPASVNAAVAGVDEPELAAGADVRIALAALADACCRCAAGLAVAWQGLPCIAASAARRCGSAKLLL